MKRHLYVRVSTESQDYDQQIHCINQYFSKMGIDPASVNSIVAEKESGGKKYTDRKLINLIDSCEPNDIIIVSELSRLSRSVNDTYNLVTYCCDRGIILIQAKDGTQIENNTIGGKAMLFGLSLGAEIELTNIRHRTNMGIAAKRRQRDEKGFWISNAGNVCTHFGRPKGCDLSVAQAASRESKRAAASQWRNQSKGYAAVRRWWGQGWTRQQILDEFNAQHEIDPDNYSTSGGTALSKGILSKWLREIGDQQTAMREAAMA